MLIDDSQVDRKKKPLLRRGNEERCASNTPPAALKPKILSKFECACFFCTALYLFILMLREKVVFTKVD